MNKVGQFFLTANEKQMKFRNIYPNLSMPSYVFTVNHLDICIQDEVCVHKNIKKINCHLVLHC